MGPGMPFPLTLQQWVECLARETARLSYPGGMSRGARPVVTQGAKTTIEEYFATKFSLEDVWSHTSRVAQAYDEWHENHARSLESVLRRGGCLGNRENEGTVVAAKFIDTFMHQLMKYDRVRSLWRHLHLPLDSRVFASLRRLEGVAASTIRTQIGARRAYALSYEEYSRVQAELWNVISELNDRHGAEIRLTSRVELNCLWL